MRKLIIISSSVLLVLCMSCRRSDIKTVVVSVPDMRNRACVEIVANSLRGQIGVKGGSDIRVDLDKRTVTVQYESLLTASKNVEYAIAASGFSANSIPGNKDAALKLPTACFSKEP